MARLVLSLFHHNISDNVLLFWLILFLLLFILLLHPLFFLFLFFLRFWLVCVSEKRTNLSTPYTFAFKSALLHFAQQCLPQIGHRIPRRYIVLRNVANHAIESYPRRHSALDPDQQLDEFALRVGRIHAFIVPFLDHRPRHGLRRIQLPLVGLQLIAAQQILDHVLIALRCRARQVGHQMKINLKCAVFEQTHRFHCVRGATSAIDFGQNRVVSVLNTNLQSSATVAAQSHNLSQLNRVRSCLQRHPNNATLAVRAVIDALFVDQRQWRTFLRELRQPVIERVCTPINIANEFLLIWHWIFAPSPAQHQNLNLVDGMTEIAQRRRTTIKLINGVPFVAMSATHTWLVGKITARHVRLVWTIITIVFARETLCFYFAGLRINVLWKWRCKDGNDQHAR
mmetsp:Transcript_17463/g.27343  ORF Transcript_17463/g.27343 Transcript_17463/m.27343 type:complete len:397 (-) Transcript_17463:343-1533(-)